MHGTPLKDPLTQWVLVSWFGGSLIELRNSRSFCVCGKSLTCEKRDPLLQMDLGDFQVLGSLTIAVNTCAIVANVLLFLAIIHG